MERCKAAHEVTQIRATFAAVGTSRPVTLKPRQRAELLRILDAWSSNGAGGEPMPEELLELRDALAHEA
jgi:hypothetical protein